MKNIAVVKKPYVTEKSTDLNKIGKYVFIVESSATKTEIKKSFKRIYGVEAVSVRTIRQAGKKRRFKNVTGIQPGHKKAIVTLKKGQSIDIG